MANNNSTTKATQAPTSPAKTESAPTTTAVARNPQEEAKALLATVTGADYYGAVGTVGEGKEEKRFPTVPYIGFRTPKTVSKLDEILAAGVEKNDAYLYDNEVIKVKPFSFHVLRSALFYTKEKDQKLLGASLTPADGFNDKIIGVAVVRIPNGDKIVFKAASFQLSGAMTHAVERLLDVLKNRGAKADTWAATSQRHRDAVAAEPKDGPSIPGARAYTTVYATTEKPQKAGGYDYQVGHGSMTVSTPKDITAFYEWFNAAKGGELALVSAQFERRVAYLRGVANGSIDPTKSRSDDAE